KEEFTRQMKDRRNHLFELAEAQTKEVVSSPQKYLQFLNLMARLDYTVTNTLLVMAQNPHAVMLKDSGHWRENKLYIKKGEKGIQILEPGGEYQREDGTYGTTYNPKYVFDVAQINTKENLYIPPQMDVSNMINGLTLDSSVALQQLDSFDGGEPVFYSPEARCIYYASGLSPQQLIQGLAREYCHVEFDKQYSNYNREDHQFFVESSAYILCQKYGVPVSDTRFINQVTSYFNGMENKDIKQELGYIKNLCEDVSERIDKGIYKSQQNKTVQRNEVSR
ncbi:MAG: hypothetical protein ACI4SR_06530, partial [Faecalibacillus sp.]